MGRANKITKITHFYSTIGAFTLPMHVKAMKKKVLASDHRMGNGEVVKNNDEYKNLKTCSQIFGLAAKFSRLGGHILVVCA